MVGAMDLAIGTEAVLLAQTAMCLWGEDCPIGWLDDCCTVLIVGRDGAQGWPIILLWGRRFTVDPTLLGRQI
jgi:hypothetical protein